MTRPMPGPPEDCYCRFGNATCQECETRGYPYSWGLCPGCLLHNGRDLGAYKRLKEVECAAHEWQAASTLGLALYAPAEVLGVDIPEDGNMYSWDRPDAEPLNRAYDTWHRFAHTRHALEES